MSQNTTQFRFENCVVRAEKSIEVSAQEAGTVAEVDVALNRAVAAGDVLIALDHHEALLAVEQAQEEVQRSEALIEKAKAVLARAKGAAKYRHADVERYEQIGQSASDAEVRSLQEAANNADIDHIIAYNDYLQAKHAADINQIRLRAAELRLSRMRISTALGGEITRVLACVGDRVEVGQPLVEVRSMETMLADFLVPEASTDLPRLVGRTVNAEFEIAGKQHAAVGQVTSCDSEVNARGMVRVHVNIQNQREDGRWILFHGKTVTLELSAR
jgi:multidrug resistance efflux pump